MRIVIAFTFAALLAVSCASAQTTWQLIWSDEFNGPAGTQPSATSWTYDLGTDCCGNNELETYTSAAENAQMDGLGNLDIHVENPSPGVYTSGRVKTEGLFFSDYGLIEARIKFPISQGIWPAFWMLGENIITVGWPFCGETDIMENPGLRTPFNDGFIPNANYGSLHGPNNFSTTANYQLPFGRNYADDFHVFAVEWDTQQVVFYVDGTPYETVTSAQAGTAWVWNTPFFIIMNVAVGGDWPGSPDATTIFPQDMLIDYVRWYQPATATASTPVITPGRVVNAASYLGSVAPGALAVLYGSNLADKVYQDVSDSNGNFVTTVGGISVSVGGVPAPLIYVSPGQINFQMPWEVAAPGLTVPVQVTRNSVTSNVENVTVAASSSPSMFLEDFTNGIAWITSTGCSTTECVPVAGGTYQLWANGLGPKNGPEQDGVPVPYNGSLTPLEIPGEPSSCQLTIGGQPATVTYCGAAPYEIIDQVNFVYPTGVTSSTSYVDATLTVNGVMGKFRVPTPAH